MVSLTRLALLPFFLYAVLIALLTVPYVQRALIFVHWANFPSQVGLSRPEAYGFGPAQVRNLNISTSDGVYLGAWHVLPHADWRKALSEIGVDGELPSSVYDESLRNRPTLLYAHGNAGNRATGHRLRIARHVSAMEANFLIFDYRGFGDSSKAVVPSEQGLLTDARAVWDWLVDEKGVGPNRIALAGQSLGTGVVAGLASSLARDGTSPRALILVAPYTSLAHLLETYRLGTIVPLLGPLSIIPGAHKLLIRFLTIQFDTRSIIKNVKTPILLIHANNDRDISSRHSELLFDDLISDAPVTTQELADGARIRRAGSVTHVQPAHGGHNAVGYSEIALLHIRGLLIDNA